MKCLNCQKNIPAVSTVCPFCEQDPTKSVGVVEFGDVTDTGYDNKFEIKTYIKEPKNRKVVLMGIGVILLVIIIFVVLIMSMFNNKKDNPALLFTKTVETFFDYFIDNFTGSSSTKSGTYELSITINGEETNYDGEYGIDTKNKIISLNGTMKDPRENTGGIIIDSKDFIFSSYLDENSLYFSSNQVYGSNQSILFPIEDKYGLLTTKNYDLGVLLSGIEYALIDALKTMNYQSSTEKINYRGETISSKRLYFVLDNAAKKKFLNTFYNTLLDDSNFLNEIARLRNTTSDEVAKIVSNYLTTSEYKYNGDSPYKTTMSIYYNGTKINRIEIDMDEEHKQKIVLDIGETKYYLDIYEDTTNILSSTLVVTTKEKEDFISKVYEITFDTNDIVMDINLELEDSKYPSIKKQEITNYKNIRDFTNEDYNILKNNLSNYLDDVSWVDSLDELFKNKCTPDLKCTCEDGEDYCNCVYEDGIIVCSKEDITSNKVSTTTKIAN